MILHQHTKLPACILAALLPGPPQLHAQTQDEPAEVWELDPFVVSAERKAFLDSLSTALSILEVRATQLRTEQASSLGELLEDLPGIGSASFGPAVGRPVVRGLSGKRVRILADGLGTGDASAVSPDHAVALDPRLLRSVKILRGPASLFYGNSAIGGAIDTQTRILPEGRVDTSTTLLEGTYQSATDGYDFWLGSELPAGSGFVALNALIRDHGNVSIPGLARREDVVIGHSHGNSPLTVEPNPFGALPNTHQASQTVTLGWKKSSGDTVFGVGGIAHLITYGVPFHSHSDVTETEVREVDNVQIELDQYRAFTEYEVRFDDVLIDALHLRASLTDYAHQEIENGRIESSFAIESGEVVLEGFRYADDQKLFEFAFGLHGAFEQFSSSSLTNPSGAIFPATESLNGALYSVVKSQYGRWVTTVALRLEEHRIRLIEFDGFEQSYTTPTLALGQEFRLSETLLVALSHTRLERAPNANELFANGGHLATGLFERGSIFQFPSQPLETEKGAQTELGFSWFGSWGSVQVNAFYFDFDRFIFLRRSAFTDSQTGLPIFDYLQRRAYLQGAEVSVSLSGRRIGLENWEVHLAYDTLEGRFERPADRADLPLPRMAPPSLLAELEYNGNRWFGGVRAKFVSAQNDVELNSETATKAYTLLDFEAGRRWQLPKAHLEATLALKNLTNEEARNHLSYLKDVAPLAGRNLFLNLRVIF